MHKNMSMLLGHTLCLPNHLALILSLQQGRVITATSVALNNYLSIQQVNVNDDISYIQMDVKDILCHLYR